MPEKAAHPPATAADPVIEAVRKDIAEKSAAKKIDRSQPGWRTRLPEFPSVAFSKGAAYFWNVETSKGPVKVRFMPDVAPRHVANFIYLSELGFFDGLTFHRVIPKFMAQGGCPNGDGRGGPSYKFPGEFKAEAKHDRGGLLSMANAGPGTDGSQFFLTFVATPWLDGKHTIFGEVVGEEGRKTLKALEAEGSPGGQTSEKLEIKKATVTTG
ncbi:MAG TPA: peptidylprolyl isomerase [Planctomycetota bacterium]|nr:peptidylprolyl isomerase [Planctomycetota bacterium]